MRPSEVGRHLGVVAASAGEAHLWHAWVGDHAGDVDRFSRELLSDEERRHLGGYKIRSGAERYVVTRSLVRIVLGDQLGIPPGDIRVSRTDTGKPVVAEGVHFNVSHSGDLILLALSRERSVGVDVERARRVARVPALVARWLTAAEREQFAAMSARGISESDAFLRIWSLKEARLKAIGVGISGAAHARLESVEAMPLDRLLAPLGRQRADEAYVGAIAFA